MYSGTSSEKAGMSFKRIISFLNFEMTKTILRADGRTTSGSAPGFVRMLGGLIHSDDHSDSTDICSVGCVPVRVGFFVPFVLMVTVATQVAGVSRAHAPRMLAIAGLANAVMRVAFGSLSKAYLCLLMLLPSMM